MAEESQSSLGMLQAGFDRIDTALASNDAASAAMLDEYLIGLSRAYGRRIGINPNALRSMAKKMIQSRVAAVAQEETAARGAKLQATSVAGAAERKFNLGMEGLKLNQEAFDRTMFRRYVGSAVSAAGATLAEGIRNGLFEGIFDGPGESDPGVEAFTAGELDDPTKGLEPLKTLATAPPGGQDLALRTPELRVDNAPAKLADLELQRPRLAELRQGEPQTLTDDMNRRGTAVGPAFEAPQWPSYGIDEPIGPNPTPAPVNPALYQLKKRRTKLWE